MIDLLVSAALKGSLVLLVAWIATSLLNSTCSTSGTNYCAENLCVVTQVSTLVAFSLC